MDALDCIHTRRSIRKYEKREVPEALVREVISAGMAAPSAKNEQPWHFVVLTDRALLEKASDLHIYAKMVRDAPVAILVCGDLALEKSKDKWVQDCSAAAENMLLAAHALGLGAVWVAVYPSEDRVAFLKEMLGLPESVFPLALIPLGYPAQPSAKVDRFKEERIHTNKW